MRARKRPLPSRPVCESRARGDGKGGHRGPVRTFLLVAESAARPGRPGALSRVGARPHVHDQPGGRGQDPSAGGPLPPAEPDPARGPVLVVDDLGVGMQVARKSTELRPWCPARNASSSLPVKLGHARPPPNNERYSLNSVASASTTVLEPAASATTARSAHKKRRDPELRT